MNPNTAIRITNLSKQYRLGLVGTGTLSHDLKRWWTMNILRQEDPYLKIGETNTLSPSPQVPQSPNPPVSHSPSPQVPNSQYVWALKDIDLEIEQGDVVGIIGKNGAGKSTMLKILSRVTKPTTGTVQYRGRIASLLEVGTGFHTEMTGRENIYMNGSIMGMTRYEITRKLDEIIAFAGVERYIDTPVKRYSSGMTVRLGFAVAAHLEPDILVVDEVLAVGDAEFQKRAIGKMQDVSKQGGRTVLFVSHNMGAVRSLCRQGIVMNEGYASEMLDVHEAVDRYLKGQSHAINNFKFRVDENEVEDLIVFIESANILRDEENKSILSGKDFHLQVNYKTRVPNTTGDLHIGIYDQFGEKLTHLAKSYTTGSSLNFTNQGSLKCTIKRLPLPPGRYSINLSLHLSGTPYHRIPNAFSFLVEPCDFFRNGKMPGTKDAKFLMESNWEVST